MKAVEILGSWILDTRSGLVFGTMLILAMVGVFGWRVWKAPQEVVLSAKEFACVGTEPAGIGARCTEYRRFR